MRPPPAEVLLGWPTPDYENPNRLGPTGTIIAVVLLASVTVLLGLRVWTRRFITRSFGLDDILILIAFVPAVGFTATGLIAKERFGWGTDVWDVRPKLYPGSLQAGLASYLFFDMATSFTKLSMLALVYRLAGGCASKTPRYLAIGLAAFVVASCISFMLVLLLQCRPLHLYWEISLRGQSCINEAIHLLVAGIINTTTDVLVVLLPLAIIVRLQGTERKLAPRQALVVNLLFAAGFLASAAGGARTYMTWLMTTHPDYNTTRRAWPSWTASTIELYVGITAASLPATKPFFAKYLPSLLDAPSLSRSWSRSKRGPGSRAQWPEEALAAAKGYHGHALTRDSLSTIHEIDEQPVFMRQVDIPEPRRVTYYDPTKPLGSRTSTGASFMSFPMRLDNNSQTTPLRPVYERSGSSSSDVSTRKQTEGASFV